jgi:hypothetical protein
LKRGSHNLKSALKHNGTDSRAQSGAAYIGPGATGINKQAFSRIISNWEKR